MPTQEERLGIVEQTVTALRMDLLQVISDNTRTMSALNRVVAQQEQSTRDVNHELTILVGVVGSQGQDIKAMKGDLATVKSDLSSVKASVEAHDKRFDSMDKKLDQVLLVLSKLTSGS